MKTSIAAIALTVLGMSSTASAGDVIGVVTTLLVRDSDGLVYVHLSGTPTGRPACAASTSYWMIPNENSEVGKKLYALLLSAKVAQQQVRIVGKNTCVRWGDGEDIEWVETY